MTLSGDAMHHNAVSPGQPVSSTTIGRNEDLSTGNKGLLDEKFAKLVDDTLKKWHTEGMSVAIIDGEETYAQGYGIATLPDIPVRPSTLFYTGSTGKSFTAAAISLLVDDNENYPQVTWDTPISSIIPDDFILPDEYATRHATVEDALSHRTGMSGHPLTFGGNTVREAARALRNLPMNKELRAAWQYCNIMYIALSHMVETVTGGWLGTFFQERICKPLGMHTTFFSIEDARKYTENDHHVHLAHGYTWDKEESVAREVPYMEGPASGAGMVISNVLDYAKYVRSMIYQNGPLSKDGYTAIITPRSFMPPYDPHFNTQVLYGLGWMIGNYQREPTIFHGGSVDGFGASMIYFPEKKWGVVAFSNAAGPAREICVWHLIDEFLGTPQEKRFDLGAFTEKSQEATAGQISTARERLYPSIPSPVLPHALPLSAYTGTYAHPAYPSLKISLEDGEAPFLHAIAMRHTAVSLNLKHVTGEYFLADILLFHYAKEPTTTSRAEFKINAKGEAEKFGVSLDIINMPDDLIWYERVTV